MDEDREFLRAQAKKCRWLAARIDNEELAETLTGMARDYEARAGRDDSRVRPAGRQP
jgi:hypothetical protein